MNSERRQRSSVAIGLIVLLVLAAASVLAFTKELPWGDAYEVKAIFANAQNLRPDSPVRIAGVEVGKVTEVEHLTPAEEELLAAAGEEADGAIGDGQTRAAAIVTMEIAEEGRPIKEDATFQLFPRLFLEGNLLVDVRPGSPSAEEVEDGHVFGIEQTAASVQIDQILTTLQSDVREQLQIALEEFGSALVDHGGATGFQELYRSSPGAYKFTSQVNQALLGTEPHDLSGLIRNLDRVVRGLGRNEQQLQDLITNFRIFAGSFAAEDAALERAIAELPAVLDASRPAFANLNAAFPPLRAFAREALPGTRTAPETLEAAQPFLAQLRRLVSRRELRGLVADLRPAVPALARLASRTPGLLEQARALSGCFNEVTIPWGNMTVPDPDFPAPGPVHQETGFGLTGLTGESRSGDANGELFRVQQGGGSNTVQVGGQTGLTDLPIEGVNPPVESAAKTPFVLAGGREVADIPCENQEPPNLETGGPGAPPPQSTAQADLDSPVASLAQRKSDFAVDLLRAQLLGALGDNAAARDLEADALRRRQAFAEHGQERFERLLGVAPGEAGR